MESAKWVGRASIDITAATAEETWSVTSDFCAAHLWMQLDACRKVEGEESVPGCIRFCSSGLNWAKERLVEFDPVGRSYKYEVMENNMGFGQYLATFMVLSAEKGVPDRVVVRGGPGRELDPGRLSLVLAGQPGSAAEKDFSSGE
ncbi:hypothetical protein HPP92_005288 [Vanilla planifolia]|uniref:Uncharacterized protein n=1 Tax=Vanilla planifolia TaxID=51239 RepID=A0A835RRX0_VANPL|nr:hypothetical protein HPP92_005288 [Vanilla planifolia]